MRHMRLTVDQRGSVAVSAPLYVPLYEIRRFVQERKEWIREQQGKRTHHISFDTKRYMRHRESAHLMLASRVGFLNEHYGFTVRRISIRNQKTLWGSCSASGNLHFNYRLYFLPVHLQEYVVVHELCHLLHHNHSKAFWRLVERTLGDYKERDRELKKYQYLLS